MVVLLGGESVVGAQSMGSHDEVTNTGVIGKVYGYGIGFSFLVTHSVEDETHGMEVGTVPPQGLRDGLVKGLCSVGIQQT